MVKLFLKCIRKLIKLGSERVVKGIKIFQKKKKTKSENMVVNNIDIFLKKKKTKSINMVVNDIEIILECKS